MTFAEILSRNLDDVEPPKPLPAGSYLGSINRLPEHVEREDFNIINFFITLISPHAVDFESEVNVKGRVVRYSFLFDKNDREAHSQKEFALKMFLNRTLGIEVKGKTLAESISEVVGKQLLVNLVWKQDKKDPDRIYNEVKSTANAY